MQYLSISFAAQERGTTSKTVRAAILAGELDAIEVLKTGGKRTWVIRKTDLRKWKGPMPHGVNRCRT